MKRYTFTVPMEILPTRIDALVRRMLPELPEYVVRDAFEARDVKMDGVRIPRSEVAREGAAVQLYTRYVGESNRLELLYEDENLLVIRKPPGVSCETDAKGGKTVAQWAGELLHKANPLAAEPFLCHRLDNQTDGLLLLAKNEKIQNCLSHAFEKRQIHKAYQCLVRGTPQKAHRFLKAYLRKDAKQSRVHILEKPEKGALEIITEYEVLQPGEVCRLRIILHTGRTHQIRAHMAFLGYPLLGDDAYGDRSFTKGHKAKQLALCATELWFSLEGELAYLNEKHFQIQPTF